MNRDDIIRMAREVGINVTEGNSFSDDMYISVLYRFANIVAAAEREACAKVCDLLSVDRGMIRDEVLKEGVLSGATMCALVIRERGAP
jgi:hypothetical protein